MKTFDEAIKAAFYLKERPVGPDMPLSMRDAVDLARDFVTSEHAKEYICGMVDMAIAQLVENANGEGPDPKEFFNFATGLAMSAFLAGVRVGQTMEKEELEP